MSPDERTALIQAGERAAAIAPLVNEALADLNNEVVDRQVRLYSDGNLTPELALAGWAQVWVLDRLLARIGSDIQRAAVARRDANAQRNGRDDESDGA